MPFKAFIFKASIEKRQLPFLFFMDLVPVWLLRKIVWPLILNDGEMTWIFLSLRPPILRRLNSFMQGLFVGDLAWTC